MNHASRTTITPRVTLLLAAAAGILVSNLFSSQPLVSRIGESFGVGPAASLISTLTMLGYAVGVVFVLPLMDILDSRRLTLSTMAVCVLALASAAWAPTATTFFIAAFLVGLSSCAAQLIVVTSALLAPEASRGRVVGSVMSGLMLGILFSRPLGSYVGGELGWRAVYAMSALAVALLSIPLWIALPRHTPISPPRYIATLASLLPLLTCEPVLRRRATYQALLMVSFSTFWTAVAWRLARPPFDLGTRGVALFALAGAGGAIIAPLAGRAGDRGWTRGATLLAHLTAAAGILLAGVAAGPWGDALLVRTPAWERLLLLAIAAVTLDIGTIGDQALGRRAINMIRPELRGRVNGLFTGMFFVGGAVGAALAGPAWSYAGWSGVCAVAAISATMALGLRTMEPIGTSERLQQAW